MPRKLPASLRVSSKLTRIPVFLEGEDAEGKTVEYPYELVEMDGPKLEEWNAFTASRTEVVDKEVRITNRDKYQAHLIGLCLKPLGESPPKTVDQIAAFGSCALNDLYKYSLIINGLARDEDDQEKN